MGLIFSAMISVAFYFYRQSEISKIKDEDERYDKSKNVIFEAGALFLVMGAVASMAG